MSLKFSLRDLLVLIAAISVACAALSNTGIWWHSIIVTVTLVGMTGLLLWGTLNPGPRRAFACGWLLFAAGYLALVFGPWMGNNLGINFITSKGLAYLELKALGDNPSPFVLNNGQSADTYSDLNLIYNGAVTYGTYNAAGFPYPLTSVWDGSGRNWADSCTTFQSTGHWLLASAFGYCGAHLAIFLFLQREVARARANQPDNRA